MSTLSENAGTLLAAEEWHAPGLWLFQWKPLIEIGPFGITKPMILAFIVVLVVIGFFWAAFSKPQLVPKGAQMWGEYAYTFVRDQIARPMIGKDGDKYLPLLFTLFVFVWIMNLMSVIPLAQFPVTSRIAYPAALALTVYIYMLYLGFKHQGFLGFFKNKLFPPGMPKWIYVILAPLEFLTNFIVNPFTHAVRLFGNMFAGHILIAMFAITGYHFLVVAVSPLGLPLGIVGAIMTVVMVAFELLIQALQAYVFAMLAANYIGGAVHAEH